MAYSSSINPRRTVHVESRSLSDIALGHRDKAFAFWNGKNQDENKGLSLPKYQAASYYTSSKPPVLQWHAVRGTTKAEAELRMWLPDLER